MTLKGQKFTELLTHLIVLAMLLMTALCLTITYQGHGRIYQRGKLRYPTLRCVYGSGLVRWGLYSLHDCVTSFQCSFGLLQPQSKPWHSTTMRGCTAINMTAQYITNVLLQYSDTQYTYCKSCLKKQEIFIHMCSASFLISLYISGQSALMAVIHCMCKSLSKGKLIEIPLVKAL